MLILLGVFLLAQIPFIYRRFQIANRAEKVNTLNANRINFSNPNFAEYKGIIHAHTNLGGHSTATFDELIDGASKANLDFVVMTEHTAENFDSSAKTLNGTYKNVLFIGGHEADTISGDRFLLIPGSAEAFQDARLETPAFLEKYQSQGKIAFVTYPEKFKSWNANFDGIEVFSLHTNAKTNIPFYAVFDFLWSFSSYPEMTFARFFVRPDANLRKFDEISQQRKITLFAGTDAHSNIGFHLFGDDAGNKLINLKIDRYEMVFRLARAHILVERNKQLNQQTVIEAIKKGNLFIGFDVLGDTSGFSFIAENGTETKIQGDEIPLGNGVKLKINSPQIARFVIFKNGEKIFEDAEKNEIIYEAKEKGIYRTEIYLDDLSEMPWIISNPIYVR